MRLESIALKGVLAFPGEVTVDVRSLPHGLIAVVGDNGEGKTTFLETAIGATYRTFPSRELPLVDYAIGKDSYLEQQFAIDGRGVFRTRVNLDGIQRKSDAVIEQLHADGTRTLLNDGKVSTFDQVVAKEFAPLDVFLASAFTAQGKSDAFLRMKPKELRGLFIRCFGIERLIAMSETARKAAALIEQRKSLIVMGRDELAREASDQIFAGLKHEMNAATSMRFDGERAMRAAHDEILVLESRAATLQQAVVAFAAADERTQALGRDLATRKSEQASVVRELDRAVHAYGQTAEQFVRDADEATERLAAAKIVAKRSHDEECATIGKRRDEDLKKCDLSIVENQKIQGMADEIRAAERQVADDDEAITALRTTVDSLRSTLMARQQDVRSVERELDIVTAQETELAGAVRGASLLETVPCGGAGPYAACQFLVDAHSARLKIAQLTAKVAGRTDLDARIDTLAMTIATYSRQILDNGKTLEMRQASRATTLPLLQYVQPLAAAEARIAELTKQKGKVAEDAAHAVQGSLTRYTDRLAHLEDEAKTAAAKAEARWQDTKARHATACQEFHAREQTATVAVAQAEQDVAAAEAERARYADSHDRAVALKVELAAARERLQSVSATTATAAATFEGLERRQRDLDAKRTRRLALDVTIGRLDVDLSDYQYLAKGLGHDGVPVLEIDAAGPTISAYTNELLAASFGPRFTLELLTQRAKADGKGMVEDFIIQVFDNKKGGAPRPMGDLSGGEKVIVAEALVSAIQIYVNTRAPMPIRTAWRDETTGNLSVENIPRYVLMLRKVMELAGLDRIFFITHSPIAMAMADAHLRIGQGQIVTILPPYAALPPYAVAA